MYACDGVADQAEINAALAGHGEVRLSDGTFTTSAPIELPEYGALHLSKGTCVKPDGDFHVVSMAPNSQLTGGRINTSDVGGFSHAAVWFDCAREFIGTNIDATPCFVRDIQLEGGVSQGYGIYLDATAEQGGAWATGVTVDNVHIRHFSDGVRLEVSKPTVEKAYNFINGASFARVYVTYADYGFRLLGNHMVPWQNVANVFTDCQFQTQRDSKRAIYLEGAHHSFESFRLWDWSAYVADPVAIEIAGGGPNRIRAFAHKDSVSDNGIIHSDVKFL